MSDVSKINLYGTEYTIKDATARTDITKLSEEEIIITYESTNESIVVAKGITLS